jgi:membrane protein DedA with SNARE-associated domain
MTAGLLAGLVAGTFVSEDLTCVLAGALILDGRLSPAPAVLVCALGIWIGDLGLWAAGRVVGRRALRWPRIRRVVTTDREARFTDWFAANARPAILGSRFLPGTRLPLYIAAGALGGSFRLFALWSLFAVSLWTPPLVLLSAGYGVRLPAVVMGIAANSWSTRLLVASTVLVVWRSLGLLLSERGRQRVIAGVSRVWRWEFWPMWLFYAPVGLWIVWLTVRHRTVTAISAANPGMPDGGIVGESKFDILSRLPAEWTIPAAAVEPGTVDSRVWQFVSHLTTKQWSFPLILKPDVGQRGVGVKLARTLEDARHYLTLETTRVVVQPYHSGPYEAGVFYYRYPGESRGRILSITDKHFPFVVGDGHATIEELIWSDSRLRMQAGRFLARYAAGRDRVLACGERLPLAIAGNHAQGTLFKDGGHLITPALEERIDRIAWSYRGFFVGRFDVRYSDVERFKAGEDLAIVELNGATAESTNIYDPEGSLVSAYRQLFRQWSIVFAIGAANQRQGAATSSLKRLLELIRAHRATRFAFETSD